MANLTISLSDSDKIQFSKFCEDNGLSVSAAINIFVKKVLDSGCIPFTIGREKETPNWATRRAMREGDRIVKNPEKYKDRIFENVEDALEELKR